MLNGFIKLGKDLIVWSSTSNETNQRPDASNLTVKWMGKCQQGEFDSIE